VPRDPVTASGTRAGGSDVKKLRRAVRELSILNDLASEIGASLDSEHITSTIVRRSVRAVGAEQGIVILHDRFGEKDMRTLTRTFAGHATGAALHIEESLLGWMQINKRPLLLNRPREDERFTGVAWDDAIRSLLCVPLLVKSELIGILAVFNRRGSSGFDEDDQRLLTILAAQSAQIVENARLHEHEEALLRMQEELRLASEIQLGLLPNEAPVVPGYDIAGASVPAEAVGGDYFDFTPLDRGRLAICLGDVSGKGLSAALLMASLQTAIRAQILLDLPPGQCLANSNTLLARSTDPHRFATCFFAVLDPHQHRVLYSSAGHDPPLLLSSAGRAERLETAGLVLGFMEGVEYETADVRMEPGDTLVVYSDGVTEATNDADRQFGEHRLQQTLRIDPRESAEDAVRRVFREVRDHGGSSTQPDDMTLVVVKRKPA
jgi:sigma-B regulation protein RsbU (phosphoserine phosphatase)